MSAKRDVREYEELNLRQLSDEEVLAKLDKARANTKSAKNADEVITALRSKYDI